MTGAVSVTSTIVSFYVLGNLTGTVTANTVENVLSITGNHDGAMTLGNLAQSGDLVIDGDVLSTASIVIGVGMDSSSGLIVCGDFAGTLQVANGTSSWIQLDGDVATTASITVSDMSGTALDVSVVILGNSTGNTMNGSAVFPKGIAPHCMVGVGGLLGPRGSIDLVNKDVSGLLLVIRGGSGRILNGGSVVGSGILPWENAVGPPAKSKGARQSIPSSPFSFWCLGGKHSALPERGTTHGNLDRQGRQC